MRSQHPRRVYDGDDGDAHVGEHGLPHIRKAQRAEQQKQPLDREGKHDILPDDPHTPLRYVHGGEQPRRVVVHQHNVSRLDRGVGAERSHRDADVRPCQHRRVVDAVADVNQRFARLLRLGHMPFKAFDLVAGQKLGVYVVKPERRGDGGAGLDRVAGQHDRRDAALSERTDHVGGRVLDRVGDDAAAHIPAVPGDVDHRPGHGGAAAGQADAVTLHLAFVPGADGHAVDDRLHAEARFLVYVRHTARVRVARVRAAQCLRDRVRGVRLGEGGERQKRVLGHAGGRLQGRDREGAACQCAGFVEYDRAGLVQKLEEAAALDEHALPRRAADRAEKRERHRDHERTRTRDDEEDERAPRPLRKPAEKQRRDDRERHRADHDGRGVVPGEFRDEALRLRLALRRALDKLEDARGGGLLERTRDLYGQHTRQVHAAGQRLLPDGHVTRQRLAGQRRRIEGGRAGRDDAVQRHAFTGPDEDRLADRDLGGVDLDDLLAAQKIRAVGANVHERGDRPP